MASPAGDGRRTEKGHPGAQRAARPTGPRPARPELEAGLADWWWAVLCGVVAVVAAVAAAVGGIDHPAAAAVVGAAVASARSHPRRAAALAAVGALAGLTVAALLGEPAPLAGVAVAAAAIQLALSPPGRLRLIAAGLLVATVVGAVALRSAGPAVVGGPVEGDSAVVLVLATIVVAAFALPAHRGVASAPAALVAGAALAVSALGIRGAGMGVAAAGLVATLGLAVARRPAAALVAAAITCTATPAAAAAPLALVAAAAAAGLGPAWRGRAEEGRGGPAGDEGGARPHPWGLTTAPARSGVEAPPPGPEGSAAERDDRSAGSAPASSVAEREADATTEALPAWVVALVVLPAAAVALDAAAGRSARSVVAVLALALAAGVPALLDDKSWIRPGPLPLGVFPAVGLGAVTLVLPGRIGWLGDPLPHWSAGAGLAALGAAIALLPLGRSRSESSRSNERTDAGPPPEPAAVPAAADDRPPPPGQLRGSTDPADKPSRRRRRRSGRS